MTRLVRILFDWDGPDGTTPARGCLNFTPTLRRDNPDSDGLILPAGFNVKLNPSGEVTVELAPTGPQWCWRVSEDVLGGVDRYVVVPAGDPDTVLEYRALQDVDPETLEPSPESLAGWTATLNEVQSLADRAETAAAAVEGAVGEDIAGAVADWLAANPLDAEPDWAQIEEYIGSLLSSGGSIHVGDGPPPYFIHGARIGDVYIDTETGDLYRLGE